MPRRTRIAAATIALAALLVIGGVPAPAAAAAPGPRVVVVLAPYLTWDDVLSGPMPLTRALAEKGVVGNANVRSGAVGAGPPTLTRGALMLSAGASALSDSRSLEGYDTTETVDSVRAGDLYRLLAARSPGKSRVLYLGSARQAAANARTSSNTQVGVLGQVMHDGGVLTAAIGNSDPGLDVLTADHSRPAATVAADADGLVDLGEVSSSVLVADASAPYGVRTDPVALERSFSAALAAGARFLVVDPGDLSRAYALSSSMTTEAAAVARTSALRSTDEAVGMVANSLAPQDLLVVVAPAVPEVEDQPPGFAPLVLSGPLDASGMAQSGIVSAPSTRRLGICTLMDVTATVVGVQGLDPAPDMVGSRISGAAAGTLEERVGLLQRQNAASLAIEGIRTTAINTYITLTIVVLLLATALVGDRGRLVPEQARGVLRWLLLLSLAFAPAGLLMFAVVRWPATPLVAGACLVGVALVIWGATALLGRGKRAGIPLLALSAVTSAVLLVDQWVGAPLSFAGVFGYSPLFGARYYGIGNEMAGALLGSSMVAGALVLDLFKERPWAGAARRWGWPALGLVVVVTTAAPFIGANIGAIAWMTVGFLVSGMVLHGKRVLTWRNAALAMVLVLVLLAAASAADMLAGGGESHLGRAISGTEQSGVEAFLTIVARKAETNMRVLGRTNWTWLLVAVLVVLGYMRWRPKGEFAETLRRYPALAAATTGALVAGLVGYFTEDSGIIIPALALLPIGIAILYLMLSRDGADPYTTGGGER